MNSDPRVFRLTPLGASLNSLAVLPLVVFGLAPAVFPEIWAEPLSLLLCASSLALAIFLAMRTFLARVEYDDDRILVVGWVWRRTIDRAQVDTVVDLLDDPSIVWWSHGRLRSTRLLVMKFVSSGMPTAPIVRRQEYLERLVLWADGLDEESIARTLADRESARDMPPRPGTRRAHREANLRRRHPPDAVGVLVLWAMPTLSFALAFASTGIGRGGLVSVDASAFGVAVVAVVVLILLLVAQVRIMVFAVDRYPASALIWGIGGGLTAALILSARAGGVIDDANRTGVTLSLATVAACIVLLLFGGLGTRRATARRVTTLAEAVWDGCRLPPMSEAHFVVTPDVWDLLVDVDALQSTLAGSRTWERSARGGALRRACSEDAGALAVRATRLDLPLAGARLGAVAAELEAIAGQRADP